MKSLNVLNQEKNDPFKELNEEGKNQKSIMSQIGCTQNISGLKPLK